MCSLFRDHTSAFDIYLTVVCGAEGSRFKPPKMIDSLFQVLSQLVAGQVRLVWQWLLEVLK